MLACYVLHEESRHTVGLGRREDCMVAGNGCKSTFDLASTTPADGFDDCVGTEVRKLMAGMFWWACRRVFSGAPLPRQRRAVPWATKLEPLGAPFT